MSKLLIVVIPDNYITENAIARIVSTLGNDDRVQVISAKSYQAVRDLENQSEDEVDRTTRLVAYEDGYKQGKFDAEMEAKYPDPNIKASQLAEGV